MKMSKPLPLAGTEGKVTRARAEKKKAGGAGLSPDPGGGRRDTRASASSLLRGLHGPLRRVACRLARFGRSLRRRIHRSLRRVAGGGDRAGEHLQEFLV